MQLSPDTEERIFMSKIADAFKNGKAFIPFITCGDPDLDTTKLVVKVPTLSSLEYHFQILRQKALLSREQISER